MDKKILCIISPFEMNQQAYVYEDGNKIDEMTFKLKDLKESMFSLVKKHEITQIDLMGSKQFNRGLRKQIKEAEMTDYSEDKLEINII